MHATGEVTAADIARLAGVGRAAVSNWRKRYPDFPPPVGGSPASPTFRLDDVERWLVGNNRMPADDPRTRLRRALLAADQIPLDRTIPRLARLLVADALAPGETGAGPTAVTRTVRELAVEIGPRAVFDLLLESYLELPAQAAATPPELAALMIALAGVRGRSVHDPACGAGALLAEAVAAGATAVTGQDVGDNGTIAEVRLHLAPRARRKVRIDVRRGDLRRDAFAGEPYDVVVCHPPFATRDWGADELAYDDRWAFGVPPRQESELAWVQHALAHTRPGGIAAVVVPPAVAARASGRRIRAELLRRGALRAVIALPAGMAAPAHLSLQVWLLRRPSGPGDRVIIVDASTYDKSEAAEIVPDLVRAGVEHRDVALVPVVDLLDEEVDLTPPRHLGNRPADVDAAEVVAQRDRLAGLLADLCAQLPRLASVSGGAALPMTSISELVRAGALALHTQPGVPVEPGDVLVPSVGQALAAEVASSPGELAGSMVLLRPSPDRIDSWFLAGFIARPSNLRLVSSLGSAQRLDIRRATVPRVPLERQRELGVLFRDLHAFRRKLIHAAESGRSVVGLVAEGLVAGTVDRRA